MQSKKKINDIIYFTFYNLHLIKITSTSVMQYNNSMKTGCNILPTHWQVSSIKHETRGCNFLHHSWARVWVSVVKTVVMLVSRFVYSDYRHRRVLLWAGFHNWLSLSKPGVPSSHTRSNLLNQFPLTALSHNDRQKSKSSFDLYIYTVFL